MRHPYRGMSAALVSCALMSIVPVFQKLALRDLRPLEGAFWNAFFCAVGAAIYFACRREWPRLRLREHGVSVFLIELGGEMLAAGHKPNGESWRVAVEPAMTDAQGHAYYDTVIALDDIAAGSSGDYRVGFEHAGRRYSHTLDARSGEPVSHDLAGVTAL